MCGVILTYNFYVLQDPKNLPPGLPANLVNLIGKGSLAAVPTTKLPEQQKPKPPPPPPKVEETPQQKQAAAKLALRQQLEKTLLQVTITMAAVFPVSLTNFSSVCQFHALKFPNMKSVYAVENLRCH